MTWLDNLRGYASFPIGLRPFLKNPLSLDDGKRILADLQAQRDQNFMRLMEYGVFNNPASPYLKMLKHAGITPDDVRSMVAKDGIEQALRALYAAGVYLTFEEFKGRKPIVRGSLTLAVHPADFENPYPMKHYYTTSGGTTGAGTRIPHDLEFQRMIAVMQNLALAYEHNAYHVPTAVWYGILPDGSAVNNTLRLATFGHVPEVWFSPNHAEPFRPGYLKYAVASYLLVVAANLYGVPVAWPQYLSLDHPEVVARWAERALKEHGRCFIIATASRGLRIGLAAQEAGIDLSGAVFALGGEPVTQAKIAGVERAGGTVFSTYANEEAGLMGLGCANPIDANDVHINQGMFEIYAQPLEVPGFAEPVPAICMTTLHPSSPFIFLNFLGDDYGVIEERDCGCGLGALGLNKHLHSIYSYSKLTGEGVTLAGSDMLHLLENVLPEKFGGSMLDYQLQEVEDEAGFVRLNLLIKPGLAIVDEGVVVDEMLHYLRFDSVAADAAQTIWRQANTIRVVRAAPVWSERGKFFSIRKLKRG